MWHIYFHIDGNKFGQTSRSAVGPEIQTNCNPSASRWNYCRLVVGVPFFCHVVLLEHTYLHDNPMRDCTAMSRSISVLLHENLFYSALPAYSGISTVKTRTNEQLFLSSLGRLQQDSVQFAVDLCYIDCVLSSFRYSAGCKNCTRSEPVHCYRRRKHNFSGLSEFFPEPTYLLLEDKRSETSSKNDSKAFLLFLFLVTHWTRTNKRGVNRIFGSTDVTLKSKPILFFVFRGREGGGGLNRADSQILKTQWIVDQL